MRRMRNQVLLPMNLEIKITENDPVRKLVEICEELDYSKLYAQYLRTWRKYNPETLFMLLVCGYMNRLYSSREIEKACRIKAQSVCTLVKAVPVVRIESSATKGRKKIGRVQYP